MIDTIGIVSDYISDELACKVERECVRREGVDIRSGEILYRFTTGSLGGSYDSRIRISVERKKWIKPENGVPVYITCAPYLYVEGSIHKAILGHNVYGGPHGVVESVRWLIDFISCVLNVKLPSWETWSISRVDVAEVFYLGYDAVQAYLRGLSAASFPRREVMRYGCSGIYAPGRTTAIKFYHKGIEFYKHDRKRLKRFMKEEDLFYLQKIANDILRVEVEIKKRKLQDDYLGSLPRVMDIDNEYVYNIYDDDVRKIVKEAGEKMERIRNAEDVEKCLNYYYGECQGSNLFATWVKLATFGEEFVKRNMKRSTYYKHIKMIKDVGISWIGTDIMISDEEKVIPRDFTPLRCDDRCILGEAEKVQELLKCYKIAS